MYQACAMKKKSFKQNRSLNMLQKKPLRSLIVLSILTCVLIVMGCTSPTPSSNLIIPTVTPLPASLSTDCEKLTPLEGTTGKDLLSWNINNIPKAKECEWKHAAVRDSYNAVVKVMSDFNKEMEELKQNKK